MKPVSSRPATCVVGLVELGATSSLEHPPVVPVGSTKTVEDFFHLGDDGDAAASPIRQVRPAEPLTGLVGQARMDPVMERVLALVLSTWVFAVNPSLCVGGLLEHSCTESRCDRHASEPRSDRHDCRDDPCRMDVTPQRLIDKDSPDHGAGLQSVNLPDLSDEFASRRVPGLSLSGVLTAPDRSACLLARNLPLLI